MIVYGLRALPLIREILEVHPKVTQPWYAYNAGAVRIFPRILSHLEDILMGGSPRVYLPEPTIEMANIATKSSSIDDGIVARLSILTNMRHEPYLSAFISGAIVCPRTREFTVSQISRYF